MTLLSIYLLLIMREAVTQRGSGKKVFLEILQNLQENTCVKVLIYLYKGIFFRSSLPQLFFKSVSCKSAANIQEETHTEMRFQKKVSSTSEWVLYCNFAGDLQNIFLAEHLWGTGSVFYIICFGASNKQHILLTSFYNLQTRICRLIKNLFEGCLYFMIYFSNFPQMLAVIEAPIIFLFQILVKQMFAVIAETVPHRCSSRKIV